MSPKDVSHRARLHKGQEEEEVVEEEEEEEEGRYLSSFFFCLCCALMTKISRMVAEGLRASGCPTRDGSRRPPLTHQQEDETFQGYQ